jgi:hypothetical protein
MVKERHEDSERFAPPPGASAPPSHSPVDSPTVKGLFFMLIAGILIIVGQFVCPILTIIGYVLALIGFFKIFTDRNSYPEPHPTNMKQSLFLYIFGIIIIIVGVIIGIWALFGLAFSAISGEVTISELFDSFATYFIISAIVVLFGSIVFIFGRYKLLIELVPPDKKGILKFALILALILIIVGLVILPYFYNEIRGSFKDNDEVIDRDNLDKLQKQLQKFQQKTIGITLVSAVLGIVSEVLFLLCFYFAYDYQKHNPKTRLGTKNPPL